MVWCTIGRWRGEELALETLRSDLQAQGYTSVYIGVYIYMASRPALLRVAMVGVAVILIILSSSLGMIINLSKNDDGSIPYIVNEVIFLSELLKLCFCVLFLLVCCPSIFTTPVPASSSSSTSLSCNQIKLPLPLHCKAKGNRSHTVDSEYASSVRTKAPIEVVKLKEGCGEVEIEEEGLFKDEGPCEEAATETRSDGMKQAELELDERHFQISLLYAARYSVPALLYVIDNSMAYVNLMYFAPPVLLILTNARVPITGFLYHFYLKKPLSLWQWVALGLLTVGMMLVSYKPEQHEDSAQDAFLNPMGLFFVLLTCLSSSSANIYNEKLLKDRELPLALQNICLYVFGLLFNGVVMSISLRAHFTQHGLFHGFSAMVWLVVFASAALGLLISVVYKFWNNMVYVCCSVLASVLNSSIAMIVFGFRPSAFYFYGSSMVSSGLLLFFWFKK